MESSMTFSLKEMPDGVVFAATVSGVPRLFVHLRSERKVGLYSLIGRSLQVSEKLEYQTLEGAHIIVAEFLVTNRTEQKEPELIRPRRGNSPTTLIGGLAPYQTGNSWGAE